MTESNRKQNRRVVVWSILLFLGINAFSWNPGWGGRRDGESGREIERYFGWPACFYCDLWRSDGPQNIDMAAYFPPIPLGGAMDFVYRSFSLVALLLNVTLVTCVAVSVLLFTTTEPGAGQKWTQAAGLSLVILAFLIVMLADKFSTNL